MKNALSGVLSAVLFAAPLFASAARQLRVDSNDSLKLTISFSSPSAIVDKEAIAKDLSRDIGSGVAAAAAHPQSSSPNQVVFHYNFKTVDEVRLRFSAPSQSNADGFIIFFLLQLDATAVAISSRIKGRVGKGVLSSRLATFCIDCVVDIHGASSAFKSGVQLRCSSSTALPSRPGVEVVAVQHLCGKRQQEVGARRKLVQTSTGVTSEIDESWQWNSVIAPSGEDGNACHAPVTGCQADGWQNLINQICATGGSYVDWIQFTWLNGYTVMYGRQNPGTPPPTCMTIAVELGEVISSVSVQTGAWMDGISFTTNFGQNLIMGCNEDHQRCGAPQMWNTVAQLATQSAIVNAQSLIDRGLRSNSSAIVSGISRTTSSGYLCGVQACDGKYVNSIQFYFMLPVVTMSSNSTLQISTGSSSSGNAASTVVSSTESNLCSVPGGVAGSLAVEQSTQSTASITVGNSYSTTYSKTVTTGWSVAVNVGADGFGVQAAYSGAVATTDTSPSAASTDTSAANTTGSSTTVTVDLTCPEKIAPDTMCTWTFSGYSTTTWSNVVWSLPASFQLLAGNRFSAAIGGSTTSGTSNRNSLSLLSLVCNGINYA